MYVSGWGALPMSGSGRQALSDVSQRSDALPFVRKWSGGPRGFVGVVGKPFRMSWSGLEALGDLWEWSGSPSGCPGVIGRPSRMSGNGREALEDVR